MNIERTFSIIKPNAIKKNVIGNIINKFEKSGLSIIAMKMIQISYIEAQEFYFEHKKKFFFKKLIDFMISGPLIIQILEGKNAVELNRKIIGMTDPDKSIPGTIRYDYSDNLTENAVHGSCSKELAEREINFFFKENEIFSRNYS